MDYKRVLTIQDISCVGQCSMTVALPIISACGIETAVLPSAVLSTHTAGFSGFTVRDLAADMPAIREHWVKEGLRFDAVYTGYLGTAEQVDYVLDIARDCRSENFALIVDPAMADHGKLYPAFDMAYVEAMKKLCSAADYLLPNITEACFLCGMEYKTEYDESYVLDIVRALAAMGVKNVVLTGISYREGHTGIVVYRNESIEYYEHEFLPNSCHGTGDIYASAFTGALIRGHDAFEAAKIAGDYTLECIRYTADDPSHWYGAKFEPVLWRLIEALK